MSKIKMTDDTLKKATAKSFEEWIEETSKCETEFLPSENFEKEMSSFLENRNKFSYKISHFKPRRSIVIIAAIFLLMLSSLSVGAVRDEVKEIFIEKVFVQQSTTKKKKPQQNNGYIQQSPTKAPTTTEPQKTIQVGYELDIDSLGYTRTEETITAQKIFIAYQSTDLNVVIHFTQSVNEIKRAQEDGFYEVVNEQQYYVCYSQEDGKYRIYWQTGEYYFKFSGNVDKETAFSYIALLKQTFPEETTTEPTDETISSPFENNYGLVIENYTQETTVEGSKATTTYSMEGSNSVVFTQEYISAVSIDENLYTKSVETIDSREYTIYQSQDSQTIIYWQDGTYQFSVSGQDAKDTLIQYAKTCTLK